MQKLRNVRKELKNLKEHDIYTIKYLRKNPVRSFTIRPYVSNYVI